MNKRIKTIIKYIEQTDKIIDIGCDQALLSIEIAKLGIKSIASDLRSNIINKCRKKIKLLNLDSFIDLRVGNGLEVIDNNEVNTLVLSGMGTHTIINILKNSNSLFKKIITISNNNHKILREEMLKLGYKISLEEIIFDKNKYYNLIMFVPGKTNYSQEELYIGINHQNINLLSKYNKYLINKLKNIKNPNLKELIGILKKY